ncbi:hypothetical protein L7F22_031872 [Adiantum nelumboides]|nr:hypothetical protein [Adiantum nelumboides]
MDLASAGVSLLGCRDGDEGCASPLSHWEVQLGRHDRLMYASAGKCFLVCSFVITSVTLAFCVGGLHQTFADLRQTSSSISLHLSVFLGFICTAISILIWVLSNPRTASAAVAIDLRSALFLVSITFVLSLVFLAHAFFTAVTILSGAAGRFAKQTS